MKPLTLASLLCLCAAPALLAPAHAAARIGVHPGFVRLVFEAPARTTIQQVQQPRPQTQNTLSISLSQPLPATPATATRPTQPGYPTLHGYQVKGKTVQVFLNQTSKAQVRLLPAAAGQQARLVVDIPSAQSGYTPPPARPAVVVRSAAARRPARPQVVLDAGHGGVDPGMQSQWVTEKEVTLDVALRVRSLLETHGVNVKMVRSADRHLSADKATDLEARSRMAEADKVAAYISIHVNAGGPDAQGIETYYFGQPMGSSTRSLAVAENGGGPVGQALTRKAAGLAQNTIGDILAQAKLSFSRQLAQKVQASLLSKTGAPNRGVHTDAFYVIRNPKTAAILTEIGFGSSPSEGPKLATSAYRQKIAEGIAQAILDFLHVD